MSCRAGRRAGVVARAGRRPWSRFLSTRMDRRPGRFATRSCARSSFPESRRPDVPLGGQPRAFLRRRVPQRGEGRPSGGLLADRRTGNICSTMTSQGSAIMRFERAVRVGNPNLVLAAAHELPKPVRLRDALRIVLVLAVGAPDHFPPPRLGSVPG